MNIDGHVVRVESIDAITAIEVKVTGIEGERMARGKFDILIRGQRIMIYRSRSCTNEKSESKKALELVRYDLTEIWNSIKSRLPVTVP